MFDKHARIVIATSALLGLLLGMPLGTMLTPYLHADFASYCHNYGVR
jgi:hypothetical protein